MAGNLDHSPSVVVQYLMEVLGLGSLPEDNAAWPIYATIEPDMPDALISITDTTGIVNGRFQFGGQLQEQYGIMIRVRHSSPETGYAKANTIATTLDEQVLRNTVTIGGSTYTVQSVNRRGNVLSLGMEVPHSKRSLFSINALVSLRMTS